MNLDRISICSFNTSVPSNKELGLVETATLIVNDVWNWASNTYNTVYRWYFNEFVPFAQNPIFSGLINILGDLAAITGVIALFAGP